jgi:Holliday junction resolvase-like predicted endonuclease
MGANRQHELPIGNGSTLGRLRGQRGEDLAVDWMKRCGYQVLERNLRRRQEGEVDLLVQRGDTLHIVEVKCGRSGPDLLLQRVDERKLQLLLRTALVAGYPREDQGQQRCQVDALLVSLGPAGPRFQLVEDLLPPEMQWAGGPDVW